MPFLWAQSPPAPTSALWCTDGGIVLIQNLLSSLAVRLVQTLGKTNINTCPVTQPVSRPSHSPLTCPSINPPAPPPPVYFNPVPDRKPAHLQVHQSICQVRQSINNWPFRGSILSHPHLSSWHTKQTKSSGTVLKKKRRTCASGVQTATNLDFHVNAE